MTPSRWRRSAAVVLLVTLALAGAPGCEWRGLNSMSLPGTQGGGPGSYVITAQMPDVTNIQPNSRVRVGDVTIGNVIKIERQGWHALVTMQLAGDVDLPANAEAKVGQTSLLGTLHIELAAPRDVTPEGRLHDGSVITLARAGAYPTTEQTLAAVSLLLNGGGLGNMQDIAKALATAFKGNEQTLRNLIGQLDRFTANVDDQTTDIIAATDSLNNLTGKFAAQQPILDRALQTIPNALAVLSDNREELGEALAQVGKFSALTNESVAQTKEALVAELTHLGPILASLADAGPDMTRSLSLLSTYPFPKDTLQNWIRGDYGNLTGIFDLTLSRLDADLLTGTRFEGKLTKLELQWGRTIGQLPSPYTAGNPLVAPYHADQGP